MQPPGEPCLPPQLIAAGTPPTFGHLHVVLFPACVSLTVRSFTSAALYRIRIRIRIRRLYWNRATLCCAEVRAYLECNPLPSEPCRGFTGDCADLPLQFRDIPGSGLETYECTQVRARMALCDEGEGVKRSPHPQQALAGPRGTSITIIRQLIGLLRLPPVRPYLAVPRSG